MSWARHSFEHRKKISRAHAFCEIAKVVDTIIDKRLIWDFMPECFHDLSCVRAMYQKSMNKDRFWRHIPPWGIIQLVKLEPGPTPGPRMSD